jgi:A/G-specific adenine glycosylase
MSSLTPAADQAIAERLAPALLAWWERHGRHDLPWQQHPTPWRVWASEIMLQQTQVATVLDYYPRFIGAFPDPAALADAPLDEVLHLWSGLGYYARARNLHRAAGLVRDRHGGEVPLDFAELAALPGIGRSTAGAILALAAGQRHPILDGNVKRVLARVFAVPGWPGASATATRLWQLSALCTPAGQAAPYTQAIMDLGATLCVRRRPACALCPLAGSCRAQAAGNVQDYPGAKPPRSRERPRRASVMLLVRARDGALLLERRPEQGIWGGLWSFPELPPGQDAAGWCAARLGSAPLAMTEHPPLQHAFTHFDLDIHPLELQLGANPAVAMEGDRWLWYKTGMPARLGLAAPVARLLAAFGESSCPIS